MVVQWIEKELASVLRSEAGNPDLVTSDDLTITRPVEVYGYRILNPGNVSPLGSTR